MTKNTKKVHTYLPFTTHVYLVPILFSDDLEFGLKRLISSNLLFYFVTGKRLVLIYIYISARKLSMGLYYKTFYDRNLRIFVIS